MVGGNGLTPLPHNDHHPTIHPKSSSITHICNIDLMDRIRSIKYYHIMNVLGQNRPNHYNYNRPNRSNRPNRPNRPKLTQSNQILTNYVSIIKGQRLSIHVSIRYNDIILSKINLYSLSTLSVRFNVVSNPCWICKHCIEIWQMLSKYESIRYHDTIQKCSFECLLNT